MQYILKEVKLLKRFDTGRFNSAAATGPGPNQTYISSSFGGQNLTISESESVDWSFPFLFR